jgi:hypothetical protein
LERSPLKTKLRIEAVMKKNEAPKPPVAHRSTAAIAALQEKNSNNQLASNIPNQKRSSQSLSKRSHSELSSRSKKTSSAENHPQSHGRVFKQHTSLDLPRTGENSRTSSQSIVKSSSEPSNKRKLESSDEEMLDIQRPHKMGKLEGPQSLDTPPKTETMMNLNLKLTILPQETAPYQIYTPPDTSEDDLFNFQPGFIGTSNYNGDKINAGC